MADIAFQTEAGTPVPALSEEQMREVDRIAMEDFGLGVLQMMENAGRNLALHVIDMLDGTKGVVTVLAGSGGNGGGGICAARHLHNRRLAVRLLLTKRPGELTGSAGAQLKILSAAGLEASAPEQAEALIAEADLTIDALLGYSLQGAPRDLTATLIDACNRHAKQVLSLDLPSGVHASTGETPGVAVTPHRTLTLALPKNGLARIPGDLYLADIGIPPEVYEPLGVHFEPLFDEHYWVKLQREGMWLEGHS